MNLAEQHTIPLADSAAFYTPQNCPVISSIEANSKGLLVHFKGHAEAIRFTWFWLRDHGIDQQSLDHATLQRQVDTFNIDPNISCKTAGLDEHGQIISIEWQDGSTSTISNYVLASCLGLAPARDQLVPNRERVYWDHNNPLSELPIASYDAVMSSEDGLLEWLENIHVYGFSLLEGTPANKNDTERLAGRIGRIQETLFDRFWELSSEIVDHGDSAYSTAYLEPHTDATYYHDAPGLQMFNCLKFDCKGGESVQVDGFAIARRLREEDPKAFETLCNVVVPGHYIEPGVHVRAERPVIRLDAQGQILQVSFNNYDRAPFYLPDAEMAEFYRAYSLFHEHALNQKNWVKIPLRPGLTLIFDNWRNMHGRMGYVGKRVFYGCYHSRSEYESRHRVLRANDLSSSSS